LFPTVLCTVLLQVTRNEVYNNISFAYLRRSTTAVHFVTEHKLPARPSPGTWPGNERREGQRGNDWTGHGSGLAANDAS